jgi:hypothetical protein
VLKTALIFQATKCLWHISQYLSIQHVLKLLIPCSDAHIFYFCSKVKDRNKSQTSTHLAIWRLLSLNCLGSRKHFRCSASLSVSRLLELCFSICSKIISWFALSMKCIRKVSSTAIDKHLSHNWGKWAVCMPWECFCLPLLPGVSGCEYVFDYLC